MGAGADLFLNFNGISELHLQTEPFMSSYMQYRLV